MLPMGAVEARAGRCVQHRWCACAMRAELDSFTGVILEGVLGVDYSVETRTQRCDTE
jgi:hypothetical protein